MPINVIIVNYRWRDDIAKMLLDRNRVFYITGDATIEANITHEDGGDIMDKWPDTMIEC